MTKNSRAKREARSLAAATGIKYTEARRASARFPSLTEREHWSPTVRAAEGWATATVIDMAISDLGVDAPFGLEYAEVESAAMVSNTVERDLIEEYDDGLLLMVATFELELSVRGFAPGSTAEAIIADGLADVVERDRSGSHVILRPRRALVQLDVREEGEEADVGEVMSFAWID